MPQRGLDEQRLSCPDCRQGRSIGGWQSRSRRFGIDLRAHGPVCQGPAPRGLGLHSDLSVGARRQRSDHRRPALRAVRPSCARARCWCWRRLPVHRAHGGRSRADVSRDCSRRPVCSAPAPQSTAWLYMFWHGGFPLLVIGYASAEGPERRRRAIARIASARRSSLSASWPSRRASRLLTAIATAGHAALPPIMAGNRYTPILIVVVSTVWVAEPRWRLPCCGCRRPHSRARRLADGRDGARGCSTSRSPRCSTPAASISGSMPGASTACWRRASCWSCCCSRPARSTRSWRAVPGAAQRGRRRDHRSINAGLQTVLDVLAAADLQPRRTGLDRDLEPRRRAHVRLRRPRT